MKNKIKKFGEISLGLGMMGLVFIATGNNVGLNQFLAGVGIGIWFISKLATKNL